MSSDADFRDLLSWLCNSECVFPFPATSGQQSIHKSSDLTFQANRISRVVIKPNITLPHGNTEEGERRADCASDNCLASCLD